jgi:hypothetical protein
MKLLIKVNNMAKNKGGRPTKYDMQIATEICDAIGSTHLGLFDLCQINPHWPDCSSIYLWLRKHKEFSQMYTQAKEDQTEVSVDYMQALMNEPHKHYDENAGRTVCDVGMMRLKMDAIKWQAAKLKPRKYGDNNKEEVANNEIHEDTMKRKQEMDAKYKKEF